MKQGFPATRAKYRTNVAWHHRMMNLSVVIGFTIVVLLIWGLK